MDINSVAYEFLCPICRCLPSDPVIAGDGFIYDRDCLHQFVRDKSNTNDIISPMTKERMGSNLIFSEAIGQTIRELAGSEQLNREFLSTIGKSDATQDNGSCAPSERYRQDSHESTTTRADPSAKALEGFCIIRGEEAEEDWEEGYEILVETALKGNRKFCYCFSPVAC